MAGKANTPSIERISVDKLIPYARNARTHSDAQVAQIAASIREFGFTNPVLIDADDGIIAGHGRVMAARKLKMADVPCIRLGHLNEAQRRLYVIADNKLALTGRACHAIELNPAYIDVAVKRWEDFTGQKAVREDVKVAA